MSSPENPTRRRILDATLGLLEQGPGIPVRMSDIAEAAGLSRQAVYLHFPTRAELLIAAARHLDVLRGVEARLAASRAAPTGRDRLEAWVAAWGDYIPEVHGVARALLAMRETDAEAAAAWNDRMEAVRDGCRAAVAALAAEGALVPDLDTDRATDLLAALLSVRTWEQLCLDGGWSQEDYRCAMQRGAVRLLVVGAGSADA